jgi:uncharacterized repeat protein (TIGR03803 family)
MFKLLTTLPLFLFWLISSSAQVTKLYTSTYLGGIDGIGTINSINSDGTGFQNIHSFTTPLPGIRGCAKLLLYNGTVFGMNYAGGTFNRGVLFCYDTLSGNYHRIHDFDGINSGSAPYGSLLLHNGIIYGTTGVGGTMNAGTVFSVDPVTLTFTKLADIDTSIGSSLNGGLIAGPNGKLFGLAQYGGANDLGSIYQFDPATNLISSVYNFDGTNGSNPTGDLLLATDGLIYGTAEYGGANSKGTLFSMDTTSLMITKLYDLGGMLSGDNPVGSLVESNGALYGVTRSGTFVGYGAIFKYNFSTLNVSGLYQFPQNNTAKTGLSTGPNNLLYGTVSISIFPHAEIFSFDPVNNIYSSLMTSNYSMFTPYGLAFDGSLTFYSMGTLNNTTLFKFRIDSHQLNILLSFERALGGSRPTSGMCFATNGKLYGATNSGGSHDAGIIYSVDPSTNVFTKEHDMDSLEGFDINSTMKESSNGLLYFTCRQGGTNGAGTLLEYNPQLQTVTKLYDMGATGGPYWPTASLTLSSGGLYGTSEYGGANPNNGCIYYYDFTTHAVTVLYSLTTTDGIVPKTALTLTSNGKLYGTASNGGAAIGTIFSYDPATAAFAKLHDFTFGVAGLPESELTDGNDGYLYGTTYMGDSAHQGILYRIELSTDIYTALAGFNVTTGISPQGRLVLTASGTLVGLTTLRGLDNAGTIFSFDRATNTITKIHDYAWTDGATNIFNSLVETDTINTGITDFEVKDGFTIFPNPAKDHCSISFNQSANDNLLSIISIDGKNILKSIPVQADLNNCVDIDLRGLPAGNYLVRNGLQNKLLQIVK